MRPKAHIEKKEGGGAGGLEKETEIERWSIWLAEVVSTANNIRVEEEEWAEPLGQNGKRERRREDAEAGARGSEGQKKENQQPTQSYHQPR